jgi:pyruvate ferredoxin oxidoreductase beta subunit
MATLKELSKRKELFTSGHRACLGCGAAIIARQVMLAAQSSGAEIVVGCATGCLEVVSTIYPYTSWQVPFFHSAFENVAASVSGVEAAYRALKKKGKINRDIKFIAFGGDGGTYDIGFQSLSGAMERGHDLLYVCYNNEAYMNTGIQRSGATPLGANTTTAPAGKVEQGKSQFRKDLTECIVAHRVPYVAQTSVGFWVDLTRKVEKAMSIKGPKFINVLQPCQLGWGYPADQTVQMGKLAADTCFWPLYEVENGVYKVNYKPKEKKPVTEYLKTQARFKHLFKPANAPILERIQADVDKLWDELLKKSV